MEALGLVANSSLRDYQVRLAKDMVYRALGGTKHAQKVADVLGSTHAAQFGLSMRRSWNVIDPMDPHNNLAKSLQPDKATLLVRALSNGQSALADDLRRAMAKKTLHRPMARTGNKSNRNNKHGGGGKKKKGTDRSATDLFAACGSIYGRGDGWRPDLLVHPCQQWIPHGQEWRGGNQTPPSAAAAAVGFDSLAPKQAQLVGCIKGDREFKHKGIVLVFQFVVQWAPRYLTCDYTTC